MTKFEKLMLSGMLILVSKVIAINNPDPYLKKEYSWIDEVRKILTDK